MNKRGTIDLICGPMYSGKTSEMYRRLKRLEYAGEKYILFKPQLDNSSPNDESEITHKPAIPVESADAILFFMGNKYPDINVVAIDEAQFFSKAEKKNLLDVCLTLKKRDYKVLICGLDMDYHGNPFGLMPELMAVANTVHKLTAICMFPNCREEAEMSYKSKVTEEQIIEGNVIELGEKDNYEARCFEHWSDCSLFDSHKEDNPKE
jgi:thymidine kinase